MISFDFKFITWMCHCVGTDTACPGTCCLSHWQLIAHLLPPPTATVTHRRQVIYQLLGIQCMWARSAVGKAQGLVSQGYGFDPDLFHKACYMPFTCSWQFEIKIGIFYLFFAALSARLAQQTSLHNYMSQKYDCHIPSIYLVYDIVAYTCHMTGI